MDIKNNIEYYKLLQGLKKVVRYKPHSGLHESVAGHCFSAVSLASDLIKTYNLNLNSARVIDLLLVHDLAEVGMDFDFPAPLVAESEKLSNKKNKLENSKMLAISKKFSREHIYNFFAEFDDMKTNESVFANLIDKLESMLYVLTNNCADFTTNEQFEFIINYANNFINCFPELDGLIAEIKEQLTKIYNQFKKNADN